MNQPLNRFGRGPINVSVFAIGIALVVASLAVAVWLARLGDIVTAAMLGLLVAAGLLLTGIGLSPEPRTG